MRMLESFGSAPYGNVAPAGVNVTPMARARATTRCGDAGQRVERNEVAAFRPRPRRNVELVERLVEPFEHGLRISAG